MLEDDIIEAIKDIKDDKKAVLTKWNMGLEFAKRKVLTKERRGELCDGLCNIFNCRYCEKYYSRDCLGCPIYNKTKNTQCDDTPFDFINDIFEGIIAYRKDRLIGAIEDEIEFLKEV